jgi:predicted permease
MLVKSPGFTAVVVLVLALGIGANTAIFSVINGVLLKTLPVRDPQDLRVIGWMGAKAPIRCRSSDSLGPRISGQQSFLSFPYPTYRDFAEQAEGFSQVFGFSYVEEGIAIRAGAVPIVAHGLMVSGNFFDGYDARALIGRPLAPQDDRRGADPVAVITYRLWQRYYDLDPHVLGQTLMINNTGFTIVGVLPQRYRGPLAGDPTDFYVPIAAQELLTSEQERLEDRREGWVRVMGRRTSGTNEAQARASLQVLFEGNLRAIGSEVERPIILLHEGCHGLALSSLSPAFVLWMFLQGLVGLVLLIACANVASLLLARGAGRQQELSVRAALGAGRWRLIRQSLVESLLLSLGGAVAGLLVCVWLKMVLAGTMTRLWRWMQPDLDYMGQSSARIRLSQGIDGTVLMFMAGIAVFTTLLFGLLPALRAARVDPAAELKGSGARGAPRPYWGRRLVAVQTALSLLLVTGAGLLTRTMVNLRKADPGYDAENLLVFQVHPRDLVRGDRKAFFDQVRTNLAEIPGVRSVALSLAEGGGWWTQVSIPGLSQERTSIPMAYVSEGWLATMGVGLLAGRDFTPADTPNSQAVALVNEAFARQMLPGANPLGAYVETKDRERYQIVGVCANYKRDLRREPSPAIYFCHAQKSPDFTGFVVRSVLPALSLAPAVRRAVAQVNPDVPLEDLTTQALRLKESLALERTLARLFVGLALLALGLSCLGLYGLMAYAVTRRTGEIGIRIALGAQPADVARSILREAGLLALLGIALGLPLTLLLAAVLSAVIYGIVPYDPATLAASGLILLAIALAAAWLPARRAARIDPMVALRYE